MKEIQYRELLLKMNYRYLKKHNRRFKTYNAFIIQLKINKIKFNKSLHERQIFNVIIAHCQCNENYMIIKYVLFSCLK